MHSRHTCKTLFLAVLASFLLLSTAMVTAQELDSYGGYVDMPAPGGATGYFRVAKWDSRWLFVTPEGHALWMLGVFNVNPGRDYTVKYRDIATWGQQTVKRLKAWGFNTLAESPSTYILPQRTTDKLPYIFSIGVGLRGFGPNSYAPPFKDLVEALDPSVYTGYPGITIDPFDPNFDAYLVGWGSATLSDAFWREVVTSPWSIGIAADETDELFGFGPGPEVLAPNGIVHPHLGWVAAAASPQRTSSSKHGATYADPKVYAKYALRDFLRAKYGTVSALNAAWGSNYTSWESSGGWGVGTGVLDENGRHTAWLGDTKGLLTGVAPTVVTDLDAFLYTFAKQYFAVTTSRIKQVAPNQLVFGPASLNGHFGLTRKPVLQAAGQYVDVLQTGMNAQLLEKTAQYAGDRPIVTWEGVVANPDSALYASPNPPESWAITTQEARGQYYAERANFLLTATTAAGIQPIAGLKFWEWADNSREQLNWGLVSFRENAYDGSEAASTSGTDAWGYPTGSEAFDYGNFLGLVSEANAQIFGSLVSQPPPANQAPVVNAGSDQIIILSTSANLDGTVIDDGLPNPPGVVTTIWTKVSGPGIVTLGSASSPSTKVTFSAAGTYILRLTATDGMLSANDEVTITVNAIADSTRPTVSITEPADGSSVSRKATVIILAIASDNVGVTKVEFYVNGSLTCLDTTRSYSCAWKVPAATGRTYQLQAKAHDVRGNVGLSSVVIVTVQ